MLTINLLPEAYRKPTVSSLQQFPRSPLALLLGGLAVSLWVLLLAARGTCQIQLADLTAHLQQLKPQKTAIDQMKAAMKALQAQQTVLGQLNHERSQWASRLNALSDVTPEGMWFTDLSFDQHKQFVLQGAAIARGGEEMAYLSRFVQALKNDPAFSSAIKDIQIESIKNVQEGDVELMEFTLTCALATDLASAKP